MSASKLPTISVVVAVLNSADALSRCLKALAALKTERVFEVVVVDDGSTVDLNPVREAWAPQLCLQWVRFPENRGPAAARNEGIRLSRGEVVLFTDADCQPEPQWLESLTSPFSRSEVSGAKGVYRT